MDIVAQESAAVDLYVSYMAKHKNKINLSAQNAALVQLVYSGQRLPLTRGEWDTGKRFSCRMLLASVFVRPRCI